MKREEAIKALEEIVKGIDGLEDQDDQGWWETSTGAEFGAQKLAALKALIATLVPEEPVMDFSTCWCCQAGGRIINGLCMSCHENCVVN